MTPELIRIRNLTVKFGDRTILNNVNAEIARGKITSLMGLNGSGKTTLLRAVLKEVPYSGTIEFRCGHDHSRPSPQHIGYVPEPDHRRQLAAHRPRPAYPHLAAAALVLRRPPSRRANHGRVARRPGGSGSISSTSLSRSCRGERQRILLALALHPRPELLLLDEPAAGIDFATWKTSITSSSGSIVRRA